jgi:hypothetical protein
MSFNVTLRTSGHAIDAEHLYLHLRSLRLGATYHENVCYNLDRIPGGTEFVWDVNDGIDPARDPSFRYEFTIEVNGSQTDSRTVS